MAHADDTDVAVDVLLQQLQVGWRGGVGVGNEFGAARAIEEATPIWLCGWHFRLWFPDGKPQHPSTLNSMAAMYAIVRQSR